MRPDSHHLVLSSYYQNVPEYDNSSVGEEEHFEMRHLIAAITDWQVCPAILLISNTAQCHRSMRTFCY